MALIYDFFPSSFGSRLEEIFGHINAFHKRLDSKLKGDQLKQKVMQCFKAWEDWAIYSNEYLIQLQNIFLGLLPEVGFYMPIFTSYRIFMKDRIRSYDLQL